MPKEDDMTFAVVDKCTQQIVYSSNVKGHAEIYINTCFEPWNFELLTINTNKDNAEDNV